MAFDLEVPQSATEADWQAFKRYVSAPYKDADPQTQAAIRDWADDLHRRRGMDNVELSHHTIADSLTGKSFNAFALNAQMFISHDAAVLGLPRLPSRTDPADMSGRYVGVLMQDLGKDEKAEKAYEYELMKIDPKSTNQNESGAVYYKSPIMKTLGEFLTAAGLPDIAQGCFKLTHFKIAKNNPAAGFAHRDQSPSLITRYWYHATIHVFRGRGTTYFLGPREDIPVTMPMGATSNHFAMMSRTKEMCDRMGVLHTATQNPEGRAVMINGNPKNLPLVETPSRWRIKPSHPAPV